MIAGWFPHGKFVLSPVATTAKARILDPPAAPVAEVSSPSTSSSSLGRPSSRGMPAKVGYKWVITHLLSGMSHEVSHFNGLV